MGNRYPDVESICRNGVAGSELLWTSGGQISPTSPLTVAPVDMISEAAISLR